MNSNTVERILARLHNTWLAVMERKGYVRIKLAIFKSVKDVHSKVYGVDAGEEGVVPASEIDALVVGDAFSPSDSHQAGTLQEGWLFTTSNLVNAGDIVEIKRADFRNRRYKVTVVERIGSTLAVFRKFKLAATGD